MTQRQIAEELGISLGGVNYCLKALMEVGWVKMENFAKSNRKLRYLYIITPRGIQEKTKITARFLAKKRCEHSALLQEIGRLEVEIADSREDANIL